MRREKAPDNFSQCRKCGARIIFVRMKSGKSMPVMKGFPLNIMYWSVVGDGSYEMIDGHHFESNRD